MNFNIAVKNNDRIYQVCDSYFLPTVGARSNELNMKSWVPEGCKDTIVNYAGHIEGRDVVKEFNYVLKELEEKNEFDIRNLTSKYIYKIVDRTLETDVATKKDNLLERTYSASLIAHKDKIFIAGEGGSIRQVSDLQSFGYGQEYFVSALKELEDIENFEDRLLVAIYHYVNIIYYLCFPIVIRDTVNLKPRIYNYEDLKAVAIKYGRGGEF